MRASLRPTASELRWFSMCSVCWWLSQWWLVFVTGFLFWLLSVDATLSDGFDNTCTVSGTWKFSRVIPRLYGWIYKSLTLSLLVIEHCVVVMNESSQSKKIWDWILWVADFWFPFYEIVFRISGGIKFWDQFEFNCCWY